MPPLSGSELYRRGIALYNGGRFFEAHEALEDLWRPTRGEPRLFLQALIHFAVAFYHHQCGNKMGAERQLRKGLRKLAGYLPVYEGLDAARLYQEGQTALEQICLGRPPVVPVFLRSPAGPAIC